MLFEELKICSKMYIYFSQPSVTEHKPWHLCLGVWNQRGLPSPSNFVLLGWHLKFLKVLYKHRSSSFHFFKLAKGPNSAQMKLTAKVAIFVFVCCFFFREKEKRRKMHFPQFFVSQGYILSSHLVYLRVCVFMWGRKGLYTDISVKGFILHHWTGFIIHFQPILRIHWGDLSWLSSPQKGEGHVRWVLGGRRSLGVDN